jgi:diguanylate cyclase (GGDEF)-like protein/PAS domain S-box-containing protein
MNTPKILVVEDEKIIAVDIRDSLQKLGYSVPEVTDSGEEAIKKVAETHPNLVLIDICLAGEINGMQVADIIRNNFHVPVLYLTEYSEDTTVERKQLTEPFSYILKPFLERDLHLAVEMALYKHQMEKKLQEENRRLVTIFDSINYGVIVTDVNGCIQRMNPMAEILTGWQLNEASAKDLTEILELVDNQTGEHINNLVNQVVAEGTVLPLPENCTLVAKDGREIPIGDHIAPMRDCDGNITGTVLVFQDITERKQTEARLLRNAFYDGLTGLPNRVLFLDRLRQAFERVKRRNNYCFAVLFLDLDGFKGINDRFGHAMGDDLLVVTAQRLESCLRSGDTVARFGGDEFAVLLQDIRDVNDAINICRRVQQTLNLAVNFNGLEIMTTASIGIALSNHYYEEPGSLLRDADTAMYRAKQQGKGNYMVYV